MEIDEAVAETSEGEVSGHERCTRQFVLAVARNAKFLSGLRKTDQFTARSAS